MGHLLRVTLGEDAVKSAVSIVSATLLPNGIPVMTTSLEETFTYHAQLKTWMLVGDSQTLRYQVGKGVVNSISFLDQGQGHLLSLSQMEDYLACALQLRSSAEYRYWLKLYSRRLSDENAVHKIEELCYMLLGPSHLYVLLYLQISHTQRICYKRLGPAPFGIYIQGVTNLTFQDLPKRELLKEVLPIFGKNRSLQRLIQSIDGAMRLIQQSESMEKLF